MPVEGHNSALEQESNSESEDKDLLLPWSTPASSPGRLQGQCCPGRLQRSSADSQGNTGPVVALVDSSLDQGSTVLCGQAGDSRPPVAAHARLDIPRGRNRTIQCEVGMHRSVLGAFA